MVVDVTRTEILRSMSTDIMVYWDSFCIIFFLMLTVFGFYTLSFFGISLGWVLVVIWCVLLYTRYKINKRQLIERRQHDLMRDIGHGGLHERLMERALAEDRTEEHNDISSIITDMENKYKE